MQLVTSDGTVADELSATGLGLNGANSNNNKRKIQDLLSAYVSKKSRANMSPSRVTRDGTVADEFSPVTDNSQGSSVNDTYRSLLCTKNYVLSSNRNCKNHFGRTLRSICRKMLWLFFGDTWIVANRVCVNNLVCRIYQQQTPVRRITTCITDEDGLLYLNSRRHDKMVIVDKILYCQKEEEVTMLANNVAEGLHAIDARIPFQYKDKLVEFLCDFILYALCVAEKIIPASA